MAYIMLLLFIPLHPHSLCKANIQCVGFSTCRLFYDEFALLDSICNVWSHKLAIVAVQCTAMQIRGNAGNFSN